MTTEQKIDFIYGRQKEFECHEVQVLIESGSVWHMEGSMGRHAMCGLDDGTYFLPDEPRYDYYGNRIPSRDELQPGTKGTIENSYNFWKNNDAEI